MKHKAYKLVLGLLAIMALTAPSAFAAEVAPAGANGYHSAWANLLEQQATKRAANSSAIVQNGVKAAATIECGSAGYIQSRYTGNFVSTELGFAGQAAAELRARATSVGPWELYQICYNLSSGLYNIFADANGAWVSTEIGYTGGLYGMLRARAAVIGSWEGYNIAGTSYGFIIKSAANNLYVSGEFGYSGNDYGMLRARSSGIGQWEEWQGTVL